jgi:hypothetical protein
VKNSLSHNLALQHSWHKVSFDSAVSTDLVASATVYRNENVVIIFAWSDLLLISGDPLWIEAMAASKFGRLHFTSCTKAHVIEI